MIGVYKIVSPSGKIYIGSSKNIEKRFASYKKMFCKSQTKLYRSFKKYGVNSHVFSVLIECNFDELYEYEHLYSNYYNVLGEKGLNCRTPSFKEIKGECTIEYREKLSKSRKGMKFTDEHKNNLKKAKIGYKLSKETIEKSALSRKGMKLSEETKHKISIARKGMVFSELTKKRISESKKGKRPSNAILVLNRETGIYYESATEAEKAHNITNQYLTRMLRGDRKNKTSFTYA